jgi:predicted permease
MTPITSSLIAVFLLIVAGVMLKRFHVIRDDHWNGFERVTYFVFFPAVVIETMARADLSRVPVLGMGGALVASILTMAALLIALRPLLESRLGIGGPAFTSIFQGATRWNTFVALGVAGSLYGPFGLTLSAVAVAAMIPLLNVLAVLVLNRYASGRSVGAAETALTLIRNPFVWSSLVGVALNLAGNPLPGPVMAALHALGAAALGAGLLLVGSGLALQRLRRLSASVGISTALRLALMPLLASLFATAFGITGAPLAVTVLCAAVPTASGSYVLARQMGGDAPLMAEIITVQTLIGLLTIPIALALLA